MPLGARRRRTDVASDTHPRAKGALPAASHALAHHEAGCDCSILEMKEHREVNQPAQVCTAPAGWVLEVRTPRARGITSFCKRGGSHTGRGRGRGDATQRRRDRKERAREKNRDSQSSSQEGRRLLAFRQRTSVTVEISKSKSKSSKAAGTTQGFLDKICPFKKGYLRKWGHCDPETQAPSPGPG